jgi:hypothetical protein
MRVEPNVDRRVAPESDQEPMRPGVTARIEPSGNPLQALGSGAGLVT